MHREKVNLMLKLIDQGFNQIEIGKKIGVSHVTICYHMKKNFAPEQLKTIRSRNCSKAAIKAQETMRFVKPPKRSIDGHKPNCLCSVCKAIRGETHGKNNPWFGHHHNEETKKLLAEYGRKRQE